LIILVGDSSTGKTRCAFEAIKAELPDWRLLQPPDAAQLTDIVDRGRLPSGVVVWLDDLQHYLAGANSLTIDAVNRMLDAGHPTVIIGTMWPEWHEKFTRPVRPASGSKSGDPHWHSRKIITGARLVVRLSDFSRQERDRAAELASEDPRLEFALQDRDFGPTQVLAGAPQLVERWEHATDPYAKAIITVGIDLDRLGLVFPLSPELLRAATPSYLSDRQIANAPPDWFIAAIDYATAELRGATSALIPVPGRTMGSIAGYEVADYLLQYGTVRRTEDPIPDLFWDACISNTSDRKDLEHLASAARHRGRFYYAERAYRLAVNNGNKWAFAELTELLAIQMRYDEAERYCRQAGYLSRAFILTAWTDLLIQQGRFEDARRIYLKAIRAGHPEEIYLRSELQRLTYGIKKLPPRMLRFAHGAFLNEVGGASDPSFIAHSRVLSRRILSDGRLLSLVEVTRMRQLSAAGSWDLDREDGDADAQPDETADQQGPSAGDEITDRGQQLREEGKLEEAEKLYRDAIHRSDTALFDLIGLLLEQGRQEEAAQAYRHAAKRGHPGALYGLAVLQAWRGRRSDATRIRRYGLDADGQTADPGRVSRLSPQPELLVPREDPESRTEPGCH
jgi:tetratricopeptide (TPR) repeat protein